MAPRRLVAASFLVFLLAGAWFLRAAPWPAPFDELQHVSLAASAQETGSLRPRIEAQRVLDPTDLSRWLMADPNYMGHPLPYYALVGLVLDRSLPPREAVRAPRLLSFALVAAAAGLGLLAALRLLAIAPLARIAGAPEARMPGAPLALAFACLLALAPLRLQVGAQVNNDALAMLGGAMVLLGLTRRGGWHGALLVAGILCAMWSKPSAGLLVGGFAGIAALLLRDPRTLALVIAAGLAGLLPYLDLLARYGTLVPITYETLSGEATRPMSPLAYLDRFARQFLVTWSVALTGNRLVNAAAAALFALALAGGVIAARRLRHPPADRADLLATAAIATFASVLAVHLIYGALSLGGSLGAASIRYYLPVWPMLVLAMAVAVAALPRGLGLAALAVALVAVLGAVVT